MNRRNFLKIAAGTTTAATLAGCTGEADDPSTTPTEETGKANQETTATTTETTTSTTATTTESKPNFELVEHDWYHDDQWTAGVKGKVKNNGDSTAEYVQVDVTFLNENEEQLSSDYTNTTDLKAGRTWIFDVMFYGDDPDAVSDYEISVTDQAF